MCTTSLAIHDAIFQMGRVFVGLTLKQGFMVHLAESLRGVHHACPGCWGVSQLGSAWLEKHVNVTVKRS